MILVRLGDRGRKVVDIQTKLTRLGLNLGLTGIDGVFGQATAKAVRHFQEKRNLEVDGFVGPETWHEMVEASYRLGDRQLYLKEPPFRGDDVREVQATLNNLGFNAGRVTGSFTSQTDRAVHDFQKNVGLPVDGIVGETTIEVMDNFKKRVRSGEITGVWERGVPEHTTSPVEERRVAIDFADEPAAAALGRALGRRLEAENATVFYTSDAGAHDVKKRADLANKKEVDVLVSFDVGRAERDSVHGSSCYYFATGDFFSARSKTLAELITNELSSSLDLPSQGVEGRNLTILRGTRMPAVVVKPAFVTNERDAALLAAPSFLDDVAQAIVAAVTRYFEEAVEVEAPVW